MFRNKLNVLAPLALLVLSSCSSTKVINSWKAEDAADVRSKKILVIARTDNADARKAFEDAMYREMRAEGIDGAVSYEFIEDLQANKQLSESEVENAKQMIRDKGFQAVAITVLKDKKQTVQINKEGGYYAGATYSSSIDPYLYNFYTYYSHPNSLPSARYSGNYVEPTNNVERSITYVLETLIFDLEKPEKEQLVGQVTASLEDPDSAIDVAGNYARTIARTLKK